MGVKGSRVSGLETPYAQVPRGGEVRTRTLDEDTGRDCNIPMPHAT